MQASSSSSSLDKEEQEQAAQFQSSQPRRRPPQPIDPAGWHMNKFPAKEHCSKCGLCETTFVSHVMDACAFLKDGMSKVDDLEVQVHGRGRRRQIDDSMVWGRNDDMMMADEARFGVMQQPMTLARGIGMENAQWTGVVTSIALAMLESNQVDAVVCIAAIDTNDSSNDSDSSSSSWSEPQTILARTRDDVLRGRGVKPALAASLNVLDEIQADTSIRRLLFCGVGCAVQAFRAIQHELLTNHLDEVYVLGTNCADNSPTPQAARNFIRDGVQIKTGGLDDDNVLGYEFMQDYRVHVKTKNNYYFCLPGSIAKQSIAPSCLACFDYTNALADVVVGYMAAPLQSAASGGGGGGAEETRMDTSWQTLTVRNERGAKMVATATAAGRLDIGPVATGTGSHENIAVATTLSDFIVQSMINDVADVGDRQQQGMPLWMGEIMAFILRTTGPKGLAFARYSIDYHILRNYLHVLKEWGSDNDSKVDSSSSSSSSSEVVTRIAATKKLPRYARDIVEHYLATSAQFRQAQDKIVFTKQQKARTRH
jgi:coenzyme F420-reducing hydrogenase beta subunit